MEEQELAAQLYLIQTDTYNANSVKILDYRHGLGYYLLLGLVIFLHNYVGQLYLRLHEVNEYVGLFHDCTLSGLILVTLKSDNITLIVS